jgi:hypothetical protein
MKIYFFLILCFLLFNSFFPVKNTICQKQGIKGNIYRVSGNQMPSPDLAPAKPKGMKAILAVFELTNINQLKSIGKFYETPPTKRIKEMQTNEDGSYKVKLKPGLYSLFVKIDSLYYSNVFDDKFNIHPVEVKKGKWALDNFKVSYDAVY